MPHGYGATWRRILPVVDASSRSICAVTEIPVGHLNMDYRVTAMATDIGDLLSALSLSGVTIVGHSLGGAVALRTTVQYSERVLSLVLADLGPDIDAGIVTELRHALREAHRLYQTADDYADALIAQHPLARPELLKWLAVATTRRLDSGSVESKYDPAILSKLERARLAEATTAENVETWRLLAGLRCPQLVVRGAVLPYWRCRASSYSARWPFNPAGQSRGRGQGH
jgi:pimeloyl-ACP methyl ester carboxylesterase